MSNPKSQKLELTWIGKGEEPQLEPRILIENPEYSYGDPASENMLIHGDNLLALKALEQDYAGKVKCIYIDPPYNTGSAFEHYDDGIEHSLWLNLISQRLKQLKSLLSEDGSIWISIDDNESHYLKVLCDEIFGRKNFIANVIWEKVYSERMDANYFSVSHDYILVYSKSENFRINQLPKDQNIKQFNFFDPKKNLPYRRRSLRKEGSESLRKDRPSMWYEIISPDGTPILPYKPDGTEGRWRWKKENVLENREDLDFIFKDGKWEIYVKQYAEQNPTRPPSTFWPQIEVGHNHEAKLESKKFNNKEVFGTPKPERLIDRIITLASNPGDLVLDSFLGSGTTAAVAHKMGRKWIGVELGDHAITHCVPRLRQVVDGEQGGISKSVDWKGGGGFKFYTLAPSLLNQDRFGQWVINKEYNPDMLAAAMAKHEGFRYAPHEQMYWKQGQSTERDFIFTTTTLLTVESLDRIHEEMHPEESLLICCKAFQAECENRYPNITLRKIPSLLLGKCEFGKEDYSFKIVNLPEELRPEREESDEAPFQVEEPASPKKSDKAPGQQSLF